MTKFTIIIPAYNEAKTIGKLLDKIFVLNLKKQIIVIDDYSNDGTQKILIRNKKKLTN